MNVGREAKDHFKIVNTKLESINLNKMTFIQNPEDTIIDKIIKSMNNKLTDVQILPYHYKKEEIAEFLMTNTWSADEIIVGKKVFTENRDILKSFKMKAEN